jgi:hypothetical protein
MLYPDDPGLHRGIPWQMLFWIALAFFLYHFLGPFPPVEQFGWLP